MSQLTSHISAQTRSPCGTSSAVVALLLLWIRSDGGFYGAGLRKLTALACDMDELDSLTALACDMDIVSGFEGDGMFENNDFEDLAGLGALASLQPEDSQDLAIT